MGREAQRATLLRRRVVSATAFSLRRWVGERGGEEGRVWCATGRRKKGQGRIHAARSPTSQSLPRHRFCETRQAGWFERGGCSQQAHAGLQLSFFALASAATGQHVWTANRHWPRGTQTRRSQANVAPFLRVPFSPSTAPLPDPIGYCYESLFGGGTRPKRRSRTPRRHFPSLRPPSSGVSSVRETGVCRVLGGEWLQSHASMRSRSASLPAREEPHPEVHLLGLLGRTRPLTDLAPAGCFLSTGAALHLAPPPSPFHDLPSATAVSSL